MTMGPQRPESSVSPTLDEYGEVCFPGSGNGAVIHRTPEELGIPRVVSDAQRFLLPHLAAIVAAAPEALRTARWQPGATLEQMERRLGLRAAEPRKKVKKMPNNSFDMESEVNRKIVAAPIETRAGVLAKELGVSPSRVYGVRSQAYAVGTLQRRSASEIGKATGGLRHLPADGAAKPAAAKKVGVD